MADEKEGGGDRGEGRLRVGYGGRVQVVRWLVQGDSAHPEDHRADGVLDDEGLAQAAAAQALLDLAKLAAPTRSWGSG